MMMSFRGSMCAIVVFMAAMFNSVTANDWRWGRATFYGIWWSLHTGSCGYGHIDYWQGTGWDVAAIPDAHYEYNWSCGKCYEVKCEPMNFKDNYGNHLDRSSACYDPNKVVTVTIVDSCPCNYASNHYSNKRWCCGDMDHFDLSYHTFDKLAARKWGVIGLKYRPVGCPASYLENRHHLGRKLKENGNPFAEKKEGPQMLVLDERYETSDAAGEPLKEKFEEQSNEEKATAQHKNADAFLMDALNMTPMQ